MDKNKFNQWIRQVADIQDVKPKFVRSVDDENLTVKYGNEWIELESKINPTLGFKFIKLKEQVDQMEIFMYGIKSAFACGDFDTVDTLLDAATKYCQTISDCADCGCNGC
jgi:hypothetical protein